MKTKSGLGIGVLLPALLWAATGAAQEGGFEGGLRTGYGLPLGEAADGGADLSDIISGVVPIWLDAGYRLNESFFLGAYFQYGIGITGDNADNLCEVADCSTSSIRLGAQFHYHILPYGEVDPWLGYGFGYEWSSLSAEASAGGQSADLSTGIRGFEFANLQAGLDFYPTENFYLGPFLSFSIGQYDTISNSCDGDCGPFDDESIDIDDKSIHNWFVFGIRGGYTGFGG